MNKIYILNLLKQIIQQLEIIKLEEDSCNEGSFTDTEFNTIIDKYNLIVKEIMKNE